MGSLQGPQIGPDRPANAACSFCSKSVEDIGTLITGTDVAICDEFVDPLRRDVGTRQV